MDVVAVTIAWLCMLAGASIMHLHVSEGCCLAVVLHGICLEAASAIHALRLSFTRSAVAFRCGFLLATRPLGPLSITHASNRHFGQLMSINDLTPSKGGKLETADNAEVMRSTITPTS